MSDNKVKQQAEWYKVLEPFAHDWMEMYRKIEKKVKQLNDEDLRKLERSLREPSKTNCWFAIYGVANGELPNIVEIEISRRKAKKESA